MTPPMTLAQVRANNAANFQANQAQRGMSPLQRDRAANDAAFKANQAQRAAQPQATPQAQPPHVGVPTQSLQQQAIAGGVQANAQGSAANPNRTVGNARLLAFQQGNANAPRPGQQAPQPAAQPMPSVNPPQMQQAANSGQSYAQYQQQPSYQQNDPGFSMAPGQWQTPPQQNAGMGANILGGIAGAVGQGAGNYFAQPMPRGQYDPSQAQIQPWGQMQQQPSQFQGQQMQDYGQGMQGMQNAAQNNLAQAWPSQRPQSPIGLMAPLPGQSGGGSNS